MHACAAIGRTRRSYSHMKRIPEFLSPFAWLFVRLPLMFSVPFALMSLAWVFGGFKYLNDRVATPLAAFVVDSTVAKVPALGGVLAANLDPFFHALAVIGLFIIGLLLAYNLSALLNWLVFRAGAKPLHYAAGPPEVPAQTGPASDPFDKVERIGIVLAGGGAKGAYQAGAMKAIYRFLAEHDALGKVKVLSSTSIGSWNALFWLASLIKPAGDWRNQSIHEQWWRAVNAKSLAAPSWYFPWLRNAFLSSAPWQRVFDRLFDRDDVRDELLKSGVHFYMTRSDVRSAQLVCATNDPNPPPIPRVAYETLGTSDPATFMAGVKAGVFASMDLPPLFPYAARNNNFYEDGGVIDNLPIQFPASLDCDLIFILPLNSDFEEKPNRTSIIARLFRVMDVRQAALERGGFKLLYLYNELAALRNALPPASTQRNAASGSAPLAAALMRRNRLINVFAVCPLKSFVRETIDTTELWNTQGAGVAFEVMQEATAGLLPGFQFTAQDKTRVALVSKSAVAWDEEF